MGSLMFGFLMLIVFAVLVWIAIARYFDRIGSTVLRFLRPFKMDKNPEEDKDES